MSFEVPLLAELVACRNQLVGDLRRAKALLAGTSSAELNTLHDALICIEQKIEEMQSAEDQD